MELFEFKLTFKIKIKKLFRKTLQNYWVILCPKIFSSHSHLTDATKANNSKRWRIGFFRKVLVLGTRTEVDVIISVLILYKNLSFRLFPFKLLSFLNELSYRYQIGLKWKVFWSSFWDNLSWNAHLMFQIDLWTVNQLLIKIFIETPIFSMPDVTQGAGRIPLKN